MSENDKLFKMRQRTKNFFKKIIPSLFYPSVQKYYRKRHNKNLIIMARKEIFKKPEIKKLFPRNGVIDMIKIIGLDRLKGGVYERHILSIQLRYYKLYEFFKKNYPEIFNKEIKIIDIGDASGLMLKALNKKNLAVNINKKAIEYINKQGIKAEIGDIENLKYKNKSFDYAFCFQTIEHVKNPVKALSELSRITKKRIFITIPYRDKTNILPLEAAQHIFEFSTKDFIKIAELAGLRCMENFPINYSESIGNKKNKESHFNFFILEPK